MKQATNQSIKHAIKLAIVQSTNKRINQIIKGTTKSNNESNK